MTQITASKSNKILLIIDCAIQTLLTFSGLGLIWFLVDEFNSPTTGDVNGISYFIGFIMLFLVTTGFQSFSQVINILILLTRKTRDWFFWIRISYFMIVIFLALSFFGLYFVINTPYESIIITPVRLVLFFSSPVLYIFYYILTVIETVFIIQKPTYAISSPDLNN